MVTRVSVLQEREKDFHARESPQILLSLCIIYRKTTPNPVQCISGSSSKSSFRGRKWRVRALPRDDGGGKADIVFSQQSSSRLSHQADMPGLMRMSSKKMSPPGRTSRPNKFNSAVTCSAVWSVSMKRRSIGPRLAISATSAESRVSPCRSSTLSKARSRSLASGWSSMLSNARRRSLASGRNSISMERTLLVVPAARWEVLPPACPP